MFSDNDNLKNTVNQSRHDDMNIDIDEMILKIDTITKSLKSINAKYLELDILTKSVTETSLWKRLLSSKIKRIF